MNATIVEPVTETSSNESVKPRQNVPELGQFGNGRTSPLMAECFTDSKRLFGLSDKAADKLARNIATDYGAVCGKQSIHRKDVKVGKVNDDDKATVKTAAKATKGFTMTDSLWVLRAMAYCDDANTNGIGQVKWKVNDRLQEYLDSLE